MMFCRPEREGLKDLKAGKDINQAVLGQESPMEVCVQAEMTDLVIQSDEVFTIMPLDDHYRSSISSTK